MRRSSCWKRPLAAFLALWVALFLGEPALVHRCAVHGDLAVAGTAAAGHAAHGMAHGANAGAEHGAPDSGHGHGCTCPGDCSVGGGVAVGIPAAHAAALDVATRETAPITPLATSFAWRAPPHFLPFANGPPAPARAA